VEISSGSLGHGLPLSVGTALGLKAQGLGARVVVLVGDAELDEGSNHEAIELAGALGLDGLTVVVVDNASSTYNQPGRIAQRFATEGWSTVAVDGRNQAALEVALKKPPIPNPDEQGPVEHQTDTTNHDGGNQPRENIDPDRNQPNSTDHSQPTHSGQSTKGSDGQSTGSGNEPGTYRRYRTERRNPFVDLLVRSSAEGHQAEALARPQQAAWAGAPTTSTHSLRAFRTQIKSGDGT
jgi:hypothetical protein